MAPAIGSHGVRVEDPGELPAAIGASTMPAGALLRRTSVPGVERVGCGI
jgi:hypothetical protein